MGKREREREGGKEEAICTHPERSSHVCTVSPVKEREYSFGFYSDRGIAAGR